MSGCLSVGSISQSRKVKGEEEAGAKNKEHVKEEKKVVGVWVGGVDCVVGNQHTNTILRVAVRPAPH